MAKNRIKSLAVAGLTGLAAILSNYNANADTLTNSCGGGGLQTSRLVFKHVTGATEGYGALDISYLNPPANGNNYKFISVEDNTELSTDAVPPESQRPLVGNLGVINTGVANTNISSANTIIKYNFAGGVSGMETNRLYLTKVHANGAYRPAVQDFDLITNITENLSVTIIGGITNVPNGNNFANVYNSCQFTNQPTQTVANGTSLTNDLTANQVSGLAYAINPANSRASIKDLTNLVWNSSSPINNDPVKVDLSWNSSVLGSITYHFTSTNNAPIISDFLMAGARGIPITNSVPTSDSDGSITNVGIAVAPANGYVSFNNVTNAVYNFTNNSAINASGNASDSFRLYSVDNNGAISTITNNVDVSMTNNAPIMGAIGGPFSGRRGIPMTNSVSLSDINGDNVNLAVAQQGTNGLVSILNNTDWVYTPSNNLPAVDSFKLYAIDAYNLGSAVTNFGNVNFTNIYPVMPNSLNISGPKGFAITNALSAFNASDADNDSLTYAIAQQGTNGTFSTLGNTNWTYISGTNSPVNDTGKVYVSDGFGGYATNNVSVSLTNNAPTLTDIVMTGARGKPITNSIPASDLDGDALTPYIAVAPTNGTLAFDGLNAIYIPSSNIPISDSFKLYVTDPYNGISSTNNSSVTLTNQPLIIGNDNYTRNLGATQDVFISDLLTNDIDPNGFNIRFAGLPNMQSTNEVSLFTNSTRIRYNCSNSDRRSDAFQYSVTNDNGVGGIGWVDINVNTNVFGQNKSIAPSNGVVNLQFCGISDFRYGIERSTNLVDWKNLTNIVSSTGPISYTDNFSDLGGNMPSSAYYRMRYNP